MLTKAENMHVLHLGKEFSKLVKLMLGINLLGSVSLRKWFKK